MTSDLQEFSEQATSWLEQNMARRTDGVASEHGAETHEYMDAQRALQRTLFDGGYAGLSWPKEYGGGGLTMAHERAFREAAANFVLPEFGIPGGATYQVCGPTILAHASEAFKAQHVPRMLAGDELWAQFFSEPAAGSDLAGVRTKATRDGDAWVLNGSKIWSSGAGFADFGLCLARTSWDVPKHRGLTWFAVPTNAPGLTIRPIRQISSLGGGATAFCEEFLDDVVVPDSERVGEVDGGWAVAHTMLGYERGGQTIAEELDYRHALPPELVELAARRGLLGDARTRQLIARGQMYEYVHGALNARIAGAMEGDVIDANLAAYVKLAHGVFTPLEGRLAMELGGASSVAWASGDDAAERLAARYLDCRVPAIAAGTNEVQRNGIGERILGLPREPSFDRDQPFSEVIRAASQWT